MRISDWSSDVCSSDLLFRLNGGPYLLCCFEKARMPALIDIIVDGADPFHIWPEARRARKVERKMGAQTAWFRRWIDEMPKGMFARIGKIIAFRESDGRNEPAFQIFGNGGDFMGVESRAIYNMFRSDCGFVIPLEMQAPAALLSAKARNICAGNKSGAAGFRFAQKGGDRKSTRLNSSH